MAKAKQEPKSKKADDGPRFISLTATPRHLGLARSVLCRLRKVHSLYAPAMVGIPGAGVVVDGQRPGLRIVRFHCEQVRLIEAVMAGNMDVEEAHLRWQIIRRRIGQAEPRGEQSPQKTNR